MAGIKDYSSTPANNTALFPEGMNPADVNNGMRQVQADIRSWYEIPQWRNLGHVPTRTTNTAFTVPGDLTGTYIVGQRLRLNDLSTLYGTVASASYSSPNTTVTVTLDSGALSASLSAVSLGLDPTNKPIPGAAIGGLDNPTFTTVTVTGNETVGGDISIAGNETVTGSITGGNGATFTGQMKSTTILTDGNAVIGDGTVNRGLILSGGTSGTGAGGYIVARNGVTATVSFGGKSAVLGGTYDATPTIYSPASIEVNIGGTVGALLTSLGITAKNIPKAWAQFSVSGGVVTINASYNITSITRNAAGDFTGTVTTALPNTNYGVRGSLANNKNNSQGVFLYSASTGGAADTKTTTQFRFATVLSATAQDCLDSFVEVMGG